MLKIALFVQVPYQFVR